jgi:hypothetical protein
MAAISNTSKNVLGDFTATKTILTASDTLTYTSGSGQELVMYNITAAPVVVTLDGASGTTVAVPGCGATTVSVASGVAITVPANGFQVVRLDTIPAYLNGAVAVTGGTGVIAMILN